MPADETTIYPVYTCDLGTFGGEMVVARIVFALSIEQLEAITAGREEASGANFAMTREQAIDIGNGLLTIANTMPEHKPAGPRVS